MTNATETTKSPASQRRQETAAEQHESHIQSLAAENRSLKTMLLDAESRIQSLTIEKSSLRNELDKQAECEQKLRKLEAKLSLRKKPDDQSAAEARRGQPTIGLLEERITNITSEKGSLLKERQSQARMIEDLRSDIVTLTAEKEGFAKKTTNQAEALRTQIANLTEGNESLRAENEKGQSRAARQWQESISRLEERIVHLTSESESVLAKLRESEETL
jgi:chromosome segregation ATPase